MSSLLKLLFLRGILLRKYLSYSFESLFFPSQMEWEENCLGCGEWRGELCGGNDEVEAGHQESQTTASSWEFWQ